MKITAISSQNYISNKCSKIQRQNSIKKNTQVSFGKMGNMPLDTYLVRMVSYGSDWEWAHKMNRATEILSSMMQKKFGIDNIIFAAENCVQNINSKATKYSKSFGVRRKAFSGRFTIVNEANARGVEYFQKYQKYFKDKAPVLNHVVKSNAQYPDAKTCVISVPGEVQSITILNGKNNPARIETNTELVKKAYNLLSQKDNPTKQEIVDTAATIQWLIAQETPYVRGSDSIANLLSRSFMHSHDIPLSPLKKGVSCDFEAFYKNLDDYIKVYPTLFEKNPLVN